ncbi:hypothetical protein [Serratia sp. SCBI]|jgi:hypothetical protein|uniref:hypothetical protein n=1 Tax=Serratia sp. SCBI TaxID=488142 RepID=UPI0004F784A0|nr:hypothetical protein [Serratia sp. SCBI]AIM24057.1 hypothetical protein SERRSCBI_22515 [Serratia sp. SCBI]
MEPRRLRKPIASVIFVLVFAVLPNIIPSRLLLTPDMAWEMVHKSNEWGLGDPEALSTAYLLMLYAAAAAVAGLCLRFMPKKSA